MPSALFIRDLKPPFQTYVVIQLLPIRSFQWNPRIPGKLAICTGSNWLFFWSIDNEDESRGDAIEIPAGMFTFWYF